MSTSSENGYVIVGELPRAQTPEEKEERLRYWEARLRAINEKDPERPEAQMQADLARRALRTGTFPETPDPHRGGNVADDWETAAATFPPGRREWKCRARRGAARG